MSDGTFLLAGTEDIRDLGEPSSFPSAIGSVDGLDSNYGSFTFLCSSGLVIFHTMSLSCFP